MKTIARWVVAPAFAAALLFGSNAASASVAAKSGEVEIYAGWYFPDTGGGGSFDDLTYGLRAGYNFGQHAGFQGTLGRFETDLSPIIDVEAYFVDLSFIWHVNPDDRGVFMLYVGPGWGTFDVSGVGGSDDSFTAHFGIGAKLSVTPTFYIRPDARLRWFEDRSDNEFDWEATVAVGWMIGGN